ncbi:glycosyltransferase involved in cell wall biosynthesis [Panacagrimonas perspica]|uniref:Glycosyltransferase involved in cell wall biosynthesis n=1 Tax=Panacagrimonas perspica TaxID=381431 RepID=A0A4R7NUC7_9GAMM|nr:glycosyltransferase [Panacagrimonas perspica]TDU24339.1 glycosyltransferase involved in cell wall biosynthesis [Panacagrimonas perspica]
MAVTSEGTAPRVAFFLATSGHSGVDRLMRNLIPAIARRGYAVDQLKVRRHGPDLGDAPGVRVIDLGSSHVYSSLPAVIGYLRRERPVVMLSDKDKVNRCSVIARALSGASTRLVLRSGTTISVDLAHRGAMDRWMQRNSMRWLYRKAQAVVVPSVAAAQDLVGYTGLPASLVQALPSPVVPAPLFEREAARPDHPWLQPGEPPVILGVGELSPRKDFATLLRAFAKLRHHGRACRLLILGRGGQRDALLAEAAALGVADDVALPGFSTEVFAYMTHAAVFALCSHWEGMPVVLIEALGCGTPVVATDCPGGSRELLEDGALGPLVPIGDVDGLAAALESLLMQPKQAERNRAAARRYEIEAATTGYLRAMGLPPTPSERG